MCFVQSRLSRAVTGVYPVIELRRYLVQTFLGWAVRLNPNENESDRQITVGLTATLIQASLINDKIELPWRT